LFNRPARLGAVMIEKRILTLGWVMVGAAILAGTPGASRADEDLFLRRQVCQAEAKGHIRPKGHQGRDFYDVIVERRRTYIAQCMVKGPQQPKTTASTLPAGKLDPKPDPLRSAHPKSDAAARPPAKPTSMRVTPRG
jgi:hypothetical protein